MKINMLKIQIVYCFHFSLKPCAAYMSVVQPTVQMFVAFSPRKDHTLGLVGKLHHRQRFVEPIFQLLILASQHTMRKLSKLCSIRSLVSMTFWALLSLPHLNKVTLSLSLSFVSTCKALWIESDKKKLDKYWNVGFTVCRPIRRTGDLASLYVLIICVQNLIRSWTEFIRKRTFFNLRWDLSFLLT